MMYVAMTFWLLVIVLTAWGVRALWSGMVKPRVINVVLLPGTLVAQLGHVLGLLVTGATVTNTALYQDDSGEPGTTQNPKPRIPIIGPMIIGMLPLIACAATILIAARFFGQQIVAALGDKYPTAILPTTLAGSWQLLRDQVDMMEALVNVVAEALPGTWQLWLFTYLLVCLAIRMAPFPGNVRGSLGAIVVLGALTTAFGLVSDSLASIVESGWGMLSLTVPTLLLLLMISAIIRGAVGLSRLIAANG